MSKHNKDSYGYERGGDANKVEEWIGFQQRTKTIEDVARAVIQKSSNAHLVNIYSDGTRMAATLWLPEGITLSSSGAVASAASVNGKKVPAVLLCHGLGGTRSHLDVKYARDICKQCGFVALTFDYRGWSDSDGIMIPDNGPSNAQLANNKVLEEARASERSDQHPVSGNAYVRVIRQPIDMTYQIADIDAAMSYLRSLPFVDVDRVGIFGTSQGGGHVITYAGMDPSRVAAVVSQAPSMGWRGFGQIRSKKLLEKAETTARNEAIHGLNAKPQGTRYHHLPGVDGVPNLRRMQLYDPVIWAPRIEAPVLVIDMDEEDLWDRNDNGYLVYKMLKESKNGLASRSEYELLKGLHYHVYDLQQKQALEKMIIFFKKHLGNQNNNAKL